MPLTNDDILTALRTECGVDTADVDSSTPLFSSGIINSFSLVALMMFVETRAGISISPMELTLENFDSIERIIAYTARIQGRAGV
jgi:acyl carrier protein